MRESADKRSRRTQRIIQTTMLELLCTQPMTSIKIVDLCTQADINRTTFYLHFSSIADVLASLQDEIIRHIFAEAKHSSTSQSPPTLCPSSTPARACSVRTNIWAAFCATGRIQTCSSTG